ncbi:MAG TPA: CvpA family protein [Verrucomicrobiae bacterium]
MSPDKLPVNWFDLALVVVLILGIWRGRKHGMSEETLPLLKWLIIPFGAALAYQPIGRLLRDSTPFGTLFCYILGYLIVVLAVMMLFSLFKRGMGGKPLGGDFFGRAEYYLGMVSGMVRFGCGTIVVLALLNARLYTQGEIHAMHKFQKDNYGSSFFPTLSSVQESVFDQSLTGPLIKKYCSQLLIVPTPPGGGQIKRATADLPGI